MNVEEFCAHYRNTRRFLKLGLPMPQDGDVIHFGGPIMCEVMEAYYEYSKAFVAGVDDDEIGEKMTDEKAVGSGAFTEDMKKNKLTLAGSDELIVKDNAAFGKAIHAEALERESKARQDRVVAEVQRLEQARVEYARQAEFATKASNWYAAKLEAIANGEFDFDLARCQLIFRDEKFAKANF